MRPIGFAWMVCWCILLSGCTSVSSMRAGDAPQTALQEAGRVETTYPRPLDPAHPILFSIEGQPDKEKLAELRRTEEIRRPIIQVLPFNIEGRR